MVRYHTNKVMYYPLFSVALLSGRVLRRLAVEDITLFCTSGNRYNGRTATSRPTTRFSSVPPYVST